MNSSCARHVNCEYIAVTSHESEDCTPRRVMVLLNFALLRPHLERHVHFTGPDLQKDTGELACVPGGRSGNRCAWGLAEELTPLCSMATDFTYLKNCNVEESLHLLRFQTSRAWISPNKNLLLADSSEIKWAVVRNWNSHLWRLSRTDSETRKQVWLFTALLLGPLHAFPV